ncbi:hypothetical protein SADUNF_SadunfUnG0010800 [Salix dunnii]|uniref:Uncharacterized protein n=1 Tax=Salix dunnii TaxID=1413687 RepID=A0A835MBT4_9ROSI|nr:hypothetical protein SADUNF_SadunfUnG0010800 [Salix dunnii]
MAEDCCSFQLISGDGVFNLEGFENFSRTTSLSKMLQLSSSNSFIFAFSDRLPWEEHPFESTLSNKFQDDGCT